MRSSPSPAAALDSYGLPAEWRHPEPDPHYIRTLREREPEWALFRDWCEQHGLRAFPASHETLLRFSRDHADMGSRLFSVWEAVDAKHSAIYWHTDANPADVLHLKGVRISPDGTVTGA